MTASAQKRHRRHANPFTLRAPISVPQWTELFGRDAPLAIDVGCGPGRFLVELAQAYPHLNVLGLEIRQHLVDNAMQMAKDMQLPYVHALLANANLHLPSILAPESVGLMSVNFPDPWYKKRHHKRRVVNPEWLEAMRPSLQKNAHIYAMSDYLPVAEQMREVLDAHPSFENQHPGQMWPYASLHGLTTEREQTHMKRGEPIYRMHFIYRGLA
jgi:tRNA (guanine-N7-)-methyltransferase